MEDRCLIDDGVIPARFLFTIRQGEPCRDNVRGELAPAETDIIKIRGRGDSWCCTFFDSENNACDIYADRPLECRLLKCWAPSAIESAYRDDRLVRAHLLKPVAGLWDLVASHQARCDYGVILPAMKRLASGADDAHRRIIAEALRYDREIRRLAVAQAGVSPDLLDFLFGRALSETLRGLGLEVRENQGRLTLGFNALNTKYLDVL